jgi:hypothetical protein
MSKWELEFSVLFLLGLWTCEMLKVSEKIFRSRFKRGLRDNRYPPDSPDAALRGDSDQSPRADHPDPGATFLGAGHIASFTRRRRQPHHRR